MVKKCRVLSLWKNNYDDETGLDQRALFKSTIGYNYHYVQNRNGTSRSNV